MRENEVAARMRLEVQPLGTTLFRNTVGRFMIVEERTGKTRWVQTGLAVGSSDFIGFTEHVIRPEDVGKKIAVFTAFETKASWGGVKSTEQKTFISRIRAAGGIAGFVDRANAATNIIKEWINRK